MDRVAIEFHKNVFLLTKFVAPNDDFKKCFKEGMFNKPNSLGFIHVSYYLLSVYYKDNLKSKIHWPVICKQTENKFRNDVRESLMTIASENPDLNFPPILASHLLLAGGSKFLLIIWKFSLVVLRTYIAQEYDSVISFAPKAGPCQELTKTFFSNVAMNSHNVISNIKKKRENLEQEAKVFYEKKMEEQNELKANIWKLRNDLKEVITNAPVNDTARKKLMEVEDDEIIKMWTDFIENILKTIKEKDYGNIKTIDKMLKTISNIVLNLKGDSQTLNALNFDRINVDPLYKFVPPEMQVNLYGLYNKESLNLQNFFCVFNLFIQKCETSFKQTPIEQSTKCYLELQMTNKYFKTVINHFQNLEEKIESYTLNQIKKKNELENSQKFILNIPEFDKVLFMPSPSIQITGYQEGRSIHQNDLKLTPIEGTHKDLFSKYAYNNEKFMYSTKKLFPVQRINFDDTTMLDISSNRYCTPEEKILTTSKLKSTFKNVDKYSRIFSTRKPNVNSSVKLMMSCTGNSMLPLMTKQQCIPLMDSCNSSQDFSQESFLLNPNFNSTIETSKLEVEKEPQKNNKRRSIGDLVERYKKLIQKRDTNSDESNVITKGPLGEEPVHNFD